MIIHVVKEGDTLRSIAESYDVSEERIALENEIRNPNRLAIGQTLVILKPETIYTVKEGDTLASIAESNGVTVMQLLRNNVFLSDRDYIYPGETIVISYEDEIVQTASINGYAYPFIDRNTLKKTLPFLTYLTIFSYQVTAEGEISGIDDDELIELARLYGVAPIMMLMGSATNQEEEINITHNVLMNPALQDKFIDDLLAILDGKDYYGVNINTPYILPEDRTVYLEFIEKFAKRISGQGYKVFTTLSIDIFEILTGVFYPDLVYEKLGTIVDYAVLISYDWGNVFLPSLIITYDTFRGFISYIAQKIPPEKLLIGMSSLGHLWRLPYIPGVTKGLIISYNTANDIAYDNGVAIQYDYNTEVASYQYISNYEYIVRFRDARSIEAFLRLMNEFNVYGGGIWNIMMFFAPMWLVINARCEIVKVL